MCFDGECIFFLNGHRKVLQLPRVATEPVLVPAHPLAAGQLPELL